MLSLLVFLVLFVGCLAKPPAVFVFDSFSPAVGPGTGASFSTGGDGRITGVKVWDISYRAITGIQFCHNDIWDEVVGHAYGIEHEIILFQNETITQVSGTYTQYIRQLIFGTSRGRLLLVGQSTQRSFNMYATDKNAELHKLSGRQTGYGITSVAAHWGRKQG